MLQLEVACALIDLLLESSRAAAMSASRASSADVESVTSFWASWTRFPSVLEELSFGRPFV